MPELAVRRFQSLGSIRYDSFQALDMRLQCAGILPLTTQGARALEDFDRLKGLLDDDELVRMSQSF
jgi:hypothetical protein